MACVYFVSTSHILVPSVMTLGRNFLPVTFMFYLYETKYFNFVTVYTFDIIFSRNLILKWQFSACGGRTCMIRHQYPIVPQTPTDSLLYSDTTLQLNVHFLVLLSPIYFARCFQLGCLRTNDTVSLHWPGQYYDRLHKAIMLIVRG